MSSDKAPEKVCYVLGNFSGEKYCVTDPTHHSGETVLATYIREDLVPKQDHIAEADKKVDEQQRRKEMFEKVALACLQGAGAPNYDFFANHTIPATRKIADKIIDEADKFAKGDE